MANKSLFATLAGKLLPNTDAENEAGGNAYRFTAEHELAQYILTGCMNGTFYATAEQQLARVLELAGQVSPEFLARLAVYARKDGYMKDTPALLCAVLSQRDPKLLEKIFDRVIDNGKMLRNFVQIMRSGTVGRKSLGSLPKRLVIRWLEQRSNLALFKDSVGTAPSLSDVIKMVHPKPSDSAREALYGYLIGKKHNHTLLPQEVQDFEAFKAKSAKKVPNVPFQMLTALEIGADDWKEIARNGSWQMTRMNLNTFLRHGVFKDEELVRTIAARLRDASEIRKAKVFPYQLLAAYVAAGDEVPFEIKEALQDAMEIAVANVPEIPGRVVVLPDVSGSMSSPVTGLRAGSTSKVRCIDVAALVAAAVVRKNRTARVIPFEQSVVSLQLNSRDSIMTNAQALASIGGGGTNCSAPLAQLNREKAKADLVIFVSDNESWVDSGRSRATRTMVEWEAFKQRNPKARLVCIDIQPYGTTQAAPREDILNVGGFSDQVFEIVSEFASGALGTNHFVDTVLKVEI